eukprot:9607420-Alexandrium_andersonii.AAC.1
MAAAPRSRRSWRLGRASCPPSRLGLRRLRPRTQQWQRWRVGRPPLPPGCGSPWPTGSRSSHWRQPAARRRLRAGMPRSPR